MFEPRAFAFDLDETLVDAEPQHVRATRAMLDALGHTREAALDTFHPPEAVATAPLPRPTSDTTGARTRDIIEALRLKLGAPQSVDELLALRHSAFLAALDEEPAVPMPGARELVEACRALGPCAVVSSGHRDDILETLRSAGLDRLFVTIVTGEDVLEAKPSPEPYKLAAARLGVIADDILVFEDSVRGVRSALDAGCRVIAVPNARSTETEAVKDAHVVLTSLTEALPLATLLKKIA